MCGIDIREIKGGARVAGVEDGGQTHAWLEGFDHDVVHEVVDNVACLTEIDGVDDFIIAIVFIAVEIFSLAAMS